MSAWAKLAIALVLWVGLVLAQAQRQVPDNTNAAPQSGNAANDQKVLDQGDRLSLLAAALDSRVRRAAEADCSHLVHAIYARAGLPYAYAPSSELYSGVQGFRRVKQPQPGDLVVWRGHVGIVVRPSDHVFFSFLRSGPGTDDYQASYWKKRGRPRFYSYVKSDDFDRQVLRRLLQVKK